MAINKRLLSIADTATYLGLTESSLRKRVERRQVPFRRLGKRIIFDLQELERFIQTLPGISLEEIEHNGYR